MMNRSSVDSRNRSAAQKWAAGGTGMAILAMVLKLFGIVDVPEDVLRDLYAAVAFIVAYFIRRAMRQRGDL